MRKHNILVIYIVVIVLYFVHYSLGYEVEEHPWLINYLEVSKLFINFNSMILLLIYLGWNLYNKYYINKVQSYLFITTLLLLWCMNLVSFIFFRESTSNLIHLISLDSNWYLFLQAVITLFVIVFTIKDFYKIQNRPVILYSSLLYCAYIIMNQGLIMTGIYSNDNIIFSIQFLLVVFYYGSGLIVLISLYISIQKDYDICISLS